MQEWLISVIAIHPYLVYGLIIILSSTQGPIIAVLGGMLLRLGVVEFVPIYAVIMIGELVGDTFWYSMGRYFGHSFVRRFGKYVSVTEAGVAAVERMFHRHTTSILVINKLTMGFGFAVVTLVTAGLSKIPFGKYLTLNTFGQFFWTAFMLTVGYLFGNAYESVDSIFGKVSLIGLLIIGFFVLGGFGRYVYKRFLL